MHNTAWGSLFIIHSCSLARSVCISTDATWFCRESVRHLFHNIGDNLSQPEERVGRPSVLSVTLQLPRKQSLCNLRGPIAASRRLSNSSSRNVLNSYF